MNPPVDEVVAVLLVEVHEALGVALGDETMPAPPQHVPQHGVVVQLAVEDGRHRTVLVVDGLVTTGHIDDREPAHAERGVLQTHRHAIPPDNGWLGVLARRAQRAI